MGFVRVAPETAGRLVRVSLAEIHLEARQAAAERERAKDWRATLDPARDVSLHGDRPPTMRERTAALARAVELERAAMFPTGNRYRLPEKAVEAALAKHGAGR